MCSQTLYNVFIKHSPRFAAVRHLARRKTDTQADWRYRTERGRSSFQYFCDYLTNSLQSVRHPAMPPPRRRVLAAVRVSDSEPGNWCTVLGCLFASDRIACDSVPRPSLRPRQAVCALNCTIRSFSRRNGGVVLHWPRGAGTGQEGVFNNNNNNALAQPSPGAPISMNWVSLR